MTLYLDTSLLVPEQRRLILEQFAEMTMDRLTSVPVTRNHFHAAARLADAHTFGLRAGDALHLAIAASHGATLCTLDRRLAAAGTALDVGRR